MPADNSYTLYEKLSLILLSTFILLSVALAVEKAHFGTSWDTKALPYHQKCCRVSKSKRSFSSETWLVDFWKVVKGYPFKCVSGCQTTWHLLLFICVDMIRTKAKVVWRTIKIWLSEKSSYKMTDVFRLTNFITPFHQADFVCLVRTDWTTNFTVHSGLCHPVQTQRGLTESEKHLNEYRNDAVSNTITSIFTVSGK